MGRIFSFVPDKAYKHRNGILPPSLFYIIGLTRTYLARERESNHLNLNLINCCWCCCIII